MQPALQRLSRLTIAHLARAECLSTLLAANKGRGAQTQPPSTPPPTPVAAGRSPASVSERTARPQPPRVGTGPFANVGTLCNAQGTGSRFLVNLDGHVDGFLNNDDLMARFPLTGHTAHVGSSQGRCCTGKRMARR